MTDHPQESIPAFVLGALAADEAIAVGQHLSVCPECRAEAEALQAVAAELPYATGARQPPPHVKRQLFARIAASHDGTPPAPTRPARIWRWPGVLAAASLAAALGLGAVALDTREQVDVLSAQLAQSRQQVERLEAQMARGQQVAHFIAAPGTQQRRLGGSNTAASASMYMQADNAHVVLVVQGLPPATPGTTYQFWLASAAGQVPSKTFDVGADGTAVLEIDAPASVSEYQQAMVTVEQAGGSRLPSDQIVLAGELATTPAHHRATLTSPKLGFGEAKPPRNLPFGRVASG
jgi:anti-sigma-K factor RskA